MNGYGMDDSKVAYVVKKTGTLFEVAEKSGYRLNDDDSEEIIRIGNGIMDLIEKHSTSESDIKASRQIIMDCQEYIDLMSKAVRKGDEWRQKTCIQQSC